MICTLYSHKLGFEKLTEILKNSIPKGKVTTSNLDDSNIITVEIKGGLFSSTSKLKILYRERIKPDYKIDEAENCSLNENLKGLHGFATSLPSNN